MQRDVIYTALLDKFEALRNLAATESITLDESQYFVLWAQRYVSNISVVNIETDIPLTRIYTGDPESGEYLVDVNKGLYTFSTEDMGNDLEISYIYKGILNTFLSLTHWNDITPDKMPALFLVPKLEKNSPVRGLPTKWELNLDLYLYVNAPQNPVLSPSALINPLLDEIETMLAPDNFDNTCTLNGLVSHVFISGDIQRGEGRISTTEIAIVPINVLVPS